MRTSKLPILLALALAPACGSGAASVEPKDTILRNGAGAEVGRVILRERGERIQVEVRVSGLAPGLHGIHLHQVARCEGPAFQSAGAHLNPGDQRRHGHRNPQGPHLGDLGNLTVAQDGGGRAQVEVVGAEARAGLPTFLGPNGVALVVHAAVDDELTDPSGNSGARIACAAMVP